MITDFSDDATADIYNGNDTKRARKALPPQLHSVAIRRLDYLDAAARLDDLRVPPGNRLHPLTGDRAGQHAIRINDQYRICFVWTPNGPSRVEITDYH
ncbi:type II toxin-antitoxin system RelE/ParE family toxin [Rubrivirga sp. S365]|uniref:Type II toxin-antitoxin system RelE/ParE family toxin n=1 Tax=Rubrivirga litoralis TaxID=3075598 RepID=A0ABU3BM26_9BACT|nr:MULTISPECIES: type II toxin-antitoxin system RelE/ParE family toxin [unclassified Rubrivirga]MDT0630339.1 type II toxin-antitoxin system RelE/ParE family toxin [Rubrivirga sp. F394]MDT7855850.1 type II toxin-antitoxin system RelE/ParE family toxin [Rubrivirga sp. S365]